MTFAGANLGGLDEFENVVFASTAVASQTFTMALRGIVTSGLLRVDSTTVLDKATFTLDIGTNFQLQAGEANALISTSGAVIVTGDVSVLDAAAFIDFGSETWTVTGGWTNSSTSVSWDAGSGTVIFDSSINVTMTFAGANLAENEFNDVDFRSTAAGTVTFTMATRGLRLGGVLDIDDAAGTTVLDTAGFNIQSSSFVDIDTGGRINIGTGDFVDIGQIDVDDLGELVMNGFTVLEFGVGASVGIVEFDLINFTGYSITGGGVPDVQWRMDPTDPNANIRVSLGDVVLATTFALYRDTIELLTTTAAAQPDGDFELVFDVSTGWSAHDMIIALPGLTWGGGGGGVPADPIIDWTWRHLDEDLMLQFIIASPNSGWTYEWLVDGKSIMASGQFGATVEYQFQLSGKHMVVLKATFIDKSYQTVKVVEAKSISFIGRYLPVLVLVVIAMWFVILVLAETWSSDSGRTLGMAIALGTFGAAYWLLQSAYLTFSLNSQWAIQMFAGMGIIIAGSSLKGAKILGMALIVSGATLLGWVYMLIVVW